MTDHVARMNGIRDNLQAFLAALPTPAANRLVTRSWKPLQAYHADELLAGVYTLISVKEGNFQDYAGNQPQSATQTMLLIARFQIAEDRPAQEIEDTELSILDNEIRAWLDQVPIDLCCLRMNEVVFSGQVQHPYGHVVVELEECAD